MKALGCFQYGSGLISTSSSQTLNSDSIPMTGMANQFRRGRAISLSGSVFSKAEGMELSGLQDSTRAAVATRSRRERAVSLSVSFFSKSEGMELSGFKVSKRQAGFGREGRAERAEGRRNGHGTGLIFSASALPSAPPPFQIG